MRKRLLVGLGVAAVAVALLGCVATPLTSLPVPAPTSTPLLTATAVPSPTPVPTPTSVPTPTPSPTPRLALPPTPALPCAGQDPTMRILPSLVEVKGQTPNAIVTGTGFIVDSKRGYILTATHVVANTYSDSLTVTFRNAVTKRARWVAQKSATDIALLQTEPTAFPELQYPTGLDSIVPVMARQGAIPYDLKELVAVGFVDSAYTTAIGRARSITVDNAGWIIIQATGSAVPGMSGGPVVNRCGELIGVLSLGSTSGNTMTAIYVDRDSIERLIAFAAARPTPAPLPTSTPPTMPPSGFYGVVLLDGHNAPDNTKIDVVVDGRVVIWTTTITFQGKSVYNVDVPGDNLWMGKVVQFKIGDTIAAETSKWFGSTSQAVNLTFRGIPVTSAHPTYQTYTHPSGLWQMSVPSTWEVNGPKLTSVNPSLEIVEFSDQKVFQMLRVERYAMYGRVGPSGIYDTSEWCKTGIAFWATREFFRWESTRSIELSGYRGCEDVFTHGSGSYRFMTIVVALVAGTDTYSLEGTTTPERWSALKPLLVQSIYSFNLPNPPQVAMTPTPAAMLTPTPTRTPTPVPLPTPQTPKLSSWSHENGDATNARAATEEKALQPALALKWSTLVARCQLKAPLVNNGVLYAFVSPRAESTGLCLPYLQAIKAYDAATGRLLWEYPLACNRLPEALASQGLLYIHCSDGIKAITTVNPTLLWYYERQNTSGRIFFSNGDLLFLWVEGNIVAVEPASGKVRWEFRPERGAAVSAVATKDTLYEVSDAGSFEAVDTDSGKPRWRADRTPVGGSSLVLDGTRLLLLQGKRLVTVVDTNTGRFLAEAPDRVQSAPTLEAVLGGVYYGFGPVGANGIRDSVVATQLDPLGVQRWKASLPTINELPTLALAFAYANNYLWVGSGFGGFHAYDAVSGKYVWRAQPKDENNAIVYLAAANGMLYGGTAQGKLYAFGKP